MTYQGDNMLSVKQKNRSLALRILHEKGELSRKGLSEAIGLTPAALTKIAGEMIAEGLLSEGDPISDGGAGRREVMLSINEKSQVALGVLINLTEAWVTATWLDGTVIFSERMEKEREADGDALTAMLAEKLLDHVAECEIATEDIIGLGISVRGILTEDQRGIFDSYGAIFQKNYPICERMAELTGYPVLLENNVQALLEAQMFLSREISDPCQIFVRCEFGIGSAMAIHGKVWKGISRQSAEIGHIPVVRQGGKLCNCGKTGCLETVASPVAICRDVLEIASEKRTPVLWKMLGGKLPEQVELGTVFDAAQNGDTEVAAVVSRAVEALASTLKSLIYIMDPGKIVLYGSLFDSDYYLSKLQAEMLEGVGKNYQVTIERSKYNHQLEDKAPALIAVSSFFEAGGQRG